MATPTSDPSRKPADAESAGGPPHARTAGDTSWRVAGLVIQFFWVLVLFIVALYVFFAIFGVYAFVSVGSLLVLVVLLAVTVLARVVAGERRHGPRDARLAAARERRGF